MMVESISAEIRHSQSGSGGFESVIRQKNDTRKDVNACITALVLRELQKGPGRVPPEIIENAFNFLTSCSSFSTTGVYNFYPPDPGVEQTNTRPKIQVPDDADDTALISLLLLQSGRMTRDTLIKHTCVVLDKHRIPAVGRLDPPWFITGAFYTWLDAGNSNIVDCCVNANVIALYAYAELKHLRGYKEACQLVSNALNWCDQSELRLASIIPFYADKQELYYAIENAVRMGASELAPVLERLECIDQKNEPFNPDRPVCCSAYGKVSWYCALLQKLRTHSIQRNCRLPSLHF
jgi:hypothetical protein